MGVMSVAYTTINGQIVSEKRNGVPSDYIPDAVGSTIALLNDTHQITDRWTYWPNGQVRTRTGTNPTPFTFVGTRGYHSDIVNNSVYVRKRILRPGLARWHTLDPLWPLEAPYAYVGGSPVTLADPSGTGLAAGGFNWCKIFWTGVLGTIGTCTCIGLEGPAFAACIASGLSAGELLLECICDGVCEVEKNSWNLRQCVEVCSRERSGPCAGQNPLDTDLCCEGYCSGRMK